MGTRQVKTSWRAALLVAALLLAALGMGQAAASPLPQPAPERLTYGQTVEGSLSADQPSASYVFAAQAGDSVTITLIATGGALDPFIALGDAGGALLATDDNSGGGLNARLSLSLPAAGDYTIQATHAGGQPPAEGGTFALNLTAAVGGAVESESAGQEAAPLGEAETAPELSVRLARLEPGLTVRDTLTRALGVRYYWFRSPEAQPVTVWPGPASRFDPLIVLYDAAFTPLVQSTASAGLHATLPAPGIYFLAAALPTPDSPGGEYGFTLEFGALPGSEGQFIPLVYGATQSGAIEDSAPGATYEFRGSAGDEVTVAMRRSAGDLDSYLSLLDANGALLFEDNDSGGGNGDAQIAYTLPADGKYLIVASRVGQAGGTTTGGYTLTLVSDAPPPPPEVEPQMPADYAELPLIAYGETVNGEISDEKHLDVYVFFGKAGELAAVEMDSMNPDDAYGLDPFLVLLDDARIPLAEDDDIVDGVQRDARIEYTLPRTAFYAVVATRFDQAEGPTAGPYTLTLRSGAFDETADEADEESAALDALAPAPLTPDQPVQGMFERALSAYSFSGSADARVDLALTSDEGTEAVAILADENLNELASGSGDALMGLTLPAAGRYVVLVGPRFGPGSAAAGGYILALTQTGELAAQEIAAGPRDLVYGDTVSGEIDDANPSLLYHFSGRAGERVRILMEAAPGSSLDPYLELHDAAGQVVDANDDINPGVVRGARLLVELPADDVYTIVASRYSGADMAPTEGEFELSLEQVEDFAAEGVSREIAPIAYGETLYGEITDDRYLVFYGFDGAAGDVVTVEVEALSGNLDSVLHLYAASGDQWVELANNDDSPTGGTFAALLSNITLPQTGKYLIAVSRYGLANETSSGAYSLTLTREG